MNQPTPSDWLRDKGAEQVLNNTPDLWKAAFDECAMTLLDEAGQVCSDAVLEVVGLPPSNPNAVGAQMRSFATANKLRVLHYRKSTRTARHSGLVAVWGKA